MSPSDLILAAILLTAPPGTRETPPPLDRWPEIQASVQHLAIQWEILDKSETKYIFADLKDFQVDLEILRQRHVDLIDVPKVADAQRLPHKAVSVEMIQFNRAFKNSLTFRLAAEPDRADNIMATISETDQLYNVWDAVRDARCDYYHITVRRMALKRIKKLIGEEAYATGSLPLNVPIWRFTETK